MSATNFFERFSEPRILEAMQDTPAIMLAGPRQAGKTTLVRRIANDRGMRFFSLDDDAVRAAATADPAGFVRNLDLVVIDEIQHSPTLILAIKKSIDEDRRPGRFLLTGSANLMTLPIVADSLAGRMEKVLLYPLSRAEINGTETNWLDYIFSDNIPGGKSAVVGRELADIVACGGYPEAVKRNSLRRRIAWLREYLDALILRDIRDIANIDRLDQMSTFIRALAHVSGNICNYSRIGGQLGMNYKTAAKYTGIFEQMFLLSRLPAWSSNRLKTLSKTPKLEFTDSGILSCLVNFNPDRNDRKLFGAILETFVHGEILKHAAASQERYNMFYFRDARQNEIDFIIENSEGRTIAIEVKASATPSREDFAAMKMFAAAESDRFCMGILLYDGMDMLPFGENLWAVPISSLF